jgi:hypothetical protein
MDVAASPSPTAALVLLMATNLHLSTTNHPDHWYEHGDIVIQVGYYLIRIILILTCSQAELTKFKVHRDLLTRQSEFFRDMFAFKQPQDALAEGSEHCPIILPGQISADAFARLLDLIGYKPYVPISSILYHRPGSERRIEKCRWGTEYHFTDDEFVATLRATDFLQCEHLFAVISRHLDLRLDAQQRLELSSVFGLESWGLPAFEEVVVQMSIECEELKVAEVYQKKVHRARMALTRGKRWTRNFRRLSDTERVMIQVVWQTPLNDPLPFDEFL